MEKEQLVKSKTSAPDKFTKKQQDHLDEVAEKVIDLEEQIELAEPEKPATPIGKNGYRPEPGSEKLVHLSIVRGQRFDPNTGKEILSPYIQKFTYTEYMNFIKKAPLLGYNIVDELYNPYKK